MLMVQDRFLINLQEAELLGGHPHVFERVMNEFTLLREGADFNMGVDVGTNAVHSILARRKHVAEKFSWESAIFMVRRKAPSRRTPSGLLSKLQEDSEAEEE